MKPMTVKFAFVVAAGCAAAIIEAGSSQKLVPEVCLLITLGIVVLFVHKNGETSAKANTVGIIHEEFFRGNSMVRVSAAKNTRPTMNRTDILPGLEQIG